MYCLSSVPIHHFPDTTPCGLLKWTLFFSDSSCSNLNQMKCDFPKGENTCKRCKSGGHVCVVEARKRRIPANKREYLLAQLRQKDAVIESLLKQLHNPYQATPMSIASYQMATSPSDRNNCDTLEWLSRLKSSLKSTDGKLFTNLRPERTVDEHSEPDDRVINPQIGHPPGGEDAEDDERDGKLPSLHVPLDLLANLSLDNTKRRKLRTKGQDKESLLNENNDTDIGVANETYFMPGPATDLDARAVLIEQHSPPEIVLHGLVTPEDVEQLFEIFYERINPFISLLDPVLHTPASTFARCPFLFTVVCAISSRYYAKKSGIYPIAMHFAKHSAANALVDGWKSVELCQAYILMSIYAVPARRWEEDRSWLYTGLAIRMATDLNLHNPSSSKPQSEKQEREKLNKTRVWMVCCNLDRSTATQFGKPSTIKEHYTLRHAKDWYKRSKYNHPYDIHLCGYSVLLQIVTGFHDEIFSDPSSPTGLNKSVDFRSVTFAHDERLTRFQEEWTTRFLQDSNPDDRACGFRCSLLPYLVGYSRLVMFSFGFQQAYRRGLQQDDYIFFTKCLTAAKSVVTNMIEGLIPSGYMRYAPDGHFIFASFASAFLLKLLRPEFSHFLSKDEEMDIFVLISRLIQTLSSPKISIDDKHIPKLYARFLAGLLARHRKEGIASGYHHPASAPHNPMPPPEGPTLTIQDSSADGVSFTVPQFQDHGAMRNNFMYNTFDQQSDINAYGPDATFSDSAIPIIIDNNSVENNIPEGELLATMQAIKNPTWWENMMLPGFSWPEQSPSPSSNGITPPPYSGADHTTNHNQANYLYLT
ncbi:hypothetical protein AX15_000766 [Amanita polypyramis BW_CC]|nr:hypothetical protein AX15_000766 [Amanita polypyramis BW_CC]